MARVSGIHQRSRSRRLSLIGKFEDMNSELSLDNKKEKEKRKLKTLGSFL